MIYPAICLFKQQHAVKLTKRTGNFTKGVDPAPAFTYISAQAQCASKNTVRCPSG